MDQLQQDASESCELLLPHRKRRDSLMAGSESSGSEESPLLDEKLGRLVEEDDVASWRSPVRSTKMWAAKLNEWGRMGTTTLVDKIVAAVSATPAEGSGDHQDALEMQQGSGKVEYLMLCIACEKGSSRLVQVKFSQPPASDAAFFRLLASEYFKIRRRYFGIKPFWNKVVKIHFVRFQTLPPYKLQQIIEVRDMDSRPDQGCTGWTRTEGASCPPTPNGMAIYLELAVLRHQMEWQST